jgi:nucleoside phosphorylase
MNTEAAPIIKKLHLRPSVLLGAKLPMKAYRGHYQHIELFLIQNGRDPIYKVQNVGTQAATLATYLGIVNFQPDLIISVGTAGGISVNGAHKMDMYLSKKIYFYDRRIPAPGYEEYGLGNYPSFNMDKIAQTLHIKTGIVCSGDAFDFNPTDYHMLVKLHCQVSENEAAAVAWVSMLMKIPMFALKGITNPVGKNAYHEFELNFDKVTQQLANTLSQILAALAHTKH